MPEAAHAGRLLDHLHLRVRDLEASKRFYAGALAPLGLAIREGEGWFSADELFVSDDGPPTSGLHVAFQAPDRETVARFHEAAIAAGGRDNGAPGEREYHPGYYGAYVLDPDGTNVEAVYHGPVRKSAPSVVFTWDEQEDYRRLGRGLDIAREYGVADLEDGEWIVGDLSRLEDDQPPGLLSAYKRIDLLGSQTARVSGDSVVPRMR